MAGIAGKTVCEDLEREGYAVTVFNFEAAAVGAPHRRDRVFFVGHSEHNGLSSAKVARGIVTASGNNEKRQNETGEFTGAGVTRSNEDVADTNHTGNRTPSNGIDGNGQEKNKGWEEQPLIRARRCGQDVADTESGKSGEQESRNRREGIGRGSEKVISEPKGYWWSVEPDVGRVAHGIPSRVDRLKCLGNAVVPQQVYPILKAIAEIEKGKRG
jgi:DNA (cytosine-5)-methyltransferase 1